LDDDDDDDEGGGGGGSCGCCWPAGGAETCCGTTVMTAVGDEAAASFFAAAGSFHIRHLFLRALRANQEATNVMNPKATLVDTEMPITLPCFRRSLTKSSYGCELTGV
jgi:hypothetical protein